jgi:predicted branched-subunit amino acid permease
LVASPAAFILCLIGMFKDERKGYAVAGLVLSLVTAALFVLPLFCRL